MPRSSPAAADHRRASAAALSAAAAAAAASAASRPATPPATRARAPRRHRRRQRTRRPSHRGCARPKRTRARSPCSTGWPTCRFRSSATPAASGQLRTRARTGGRGHSDAAAARRAAPRSQRAAARSTRGEPSPRPPSSDRATATVLPRQRETSPAGGGNHRTALVLLSKKKKKKNSRHLTETATKVWHFPDQVVDALPTPSPEPAFLTLRVIGDWRVTCGFSGPLAPRVLPSKQGARKVATACGLCARARVGAAKGRVRVRPAPNQGRAGGESKGRRPWRGASDRSERLCCRVRSSGRQ